MSNKFRHQISLVFNIVLAVTVIAIARHRLGRESALPAGQGTSARKANKVGQEDAMAQMPSFAEQSAMPQYSDIKSPADRRRWMIARLRAMGVPNDLLATVARVDFEVQWDSRFDDCHGNMNKLAAVQLAMNMSKDNEMRAALGEAGFRQWDQKTMLWEAMSTSVAVTSAEAATIYDLKKKLQQRQLELDQSRLNGTTDDAQINQAYDQAYSDFYSQMKGVLGEERYKKSQQLDDDFMAGNLRAQLAKVNTTDSQFQELFKADQQFNQARLEFDHQFNGDPSSAPYQDQINALNTVRDQEYQRVLGSNVFYSFQEQQDPGYSQMKKYEDLWGLDDSKIDYVYNTMKQYQKSLVDYQARLFGLQAQGQSVDVSTVKNYLQQISSQAQDSLQGYLGADSFNKLQRNRVVQFTQSGSLQRAPF